MPLLASVLLDRLGRPGDIRLGTLPRGGPPLLPTGIAALDDVLGGGLPRGRIAEITGGRSTGRTGLVCALAATATRRGEIVGWVDPADALEPDTIAASGVAFRRTLWIRPRTATDAVRAAECVTDAGGFGLVVLDLTDAPPTLAVPWVRCARAAERTRTTLVVLSVARRAGPHAAVGLELSVRHTQWDRGRGRPTSLDGIRAALTVVRHRHGIPGSTVMVRHACA